MQVKKSLITLALAAIAVSAGAVRLPSIIGSNMVLQQNSSAHLWGWSSPGKTVTVTPSWSNEAVTATAGKDGRWDVNVNTPAASFTSYEITFDDGEPVKADNVLIGEVWFASGQSNMEMPLRGFTSQPIEDAGRTIAYSGNYPGIRFANIPKAASYELQSDVPTEWKVSSPKNAGEFSALAYHFAKTLRDVLHVPVGIINCAYGGSKVEGWIPKEILDTYPDWSIENEKKNDSLQEYERINVMYNAMLNPVAGYTVKGFLWNQGESNVGRHNEYLYHQKDMVEHWRKRWGDDNLPFYFMELALADYGYPHHNPAALFREKQYEAAKITPNSYIIPSIDLFNEDETYIYHASRKPEMGERMAFSALANTYGVKGMPHIAPTFKSMDVEGNKAVLHFNDSWSGFYPRTDLKGFEVAGADRVFYPATANGDLDKGLITLTSDKVKDIKAVRYCFKNAEIGHVHDLLGMPLVPFRTDDWDDVNGYEEIVK